MDVETNLPDPAFVADACTLPTAEQPLRLAEFRTLFTSDLRRIERVSRTYLTLALDGSAQVERTARDLTARESECCAFFGFTFDRPPGSGTLELHVEVPESSTDVLDGVERLASSSMRERRT